MEISQGNSFTDPGAFADGGEEITVTGSVDPDVPGTYTLTYTAIDEAGNVGTATREVIIIATTTTTTTTAGNRNLQTYQLTRFWWRFSFELDS